MADDQILGREGALFSGPSSTSCGCDLEYKGLAIVDRLHAKY
jgi:hypothetical protein